MKTKTTNNLIAASLSVFLFTGCSENLSDFSLNIGGKEYLSHATKTVSNFIKANKDITNEQEYYIGRAVAASIYNKYDPHIDRESTLYLNQVGQFLALHSNQPNTFGGYRFDILNSEEVNAFAAPGGLIMVTKGLIKICDSEDALASVLAHEIAHVEFKHGLASIKQSRNMDALTKSTLNIINDEDNGLTNQMILETFGDALGDIVNQMVVEGYSRSAELEADARAIEILNKAGYQQAAIIPMLEKMEKRLENDTHGFGTTHPSPKDRLENVRKLVNDTSFNVTNARKARFAKFKKRL